MTNEPLAAPLNPSEVLAQVAGAVPEQVRGNIIVCGSLAAPYNFFSGDGAASLRTKDVDVLFSPHAVAVDAAVEVTERLLAANWTQREDAQFGKAGRPEDETKDLPVVRLRPPAGAEPAQWFLELLLAPPDYKAGAEAKTHQRLRTSAGDFTIPSFAFLALAEWQPMKTKHGVLIRWPDLHHCDHCGACLAESEEDRTGARSADGIEVLVDDLVASLGLMSPEPAWAWCRALERAVYATTERQRAALCRRLGLQPRALNGWLRKGEKVALDSLLRICAGLRLKPSQMLEGDVIGKGVFLSATRHQRAPLVRHDMQKRAEVEACLKAALQSDHPPTLRSVAERAGVSRDI
jgi:hypothetical protein